MNYQKHNMRRKKMKKLLIISVGIVSLSLSNISLSLADESATTAEDTTQTQENPKLLPDSGSCGNGCLYEITTDTATGKQNLRVYNDPSYTGTANIADYAFTSSYDKDGNHYNYYDNAKFDKITIDGNFDTIGRNAFSIFCSSVLSLSQQKELKQDIENKVRVCVILKKYGITKPTYYRYKESFGY